MEFDFNTSHVSINRKQRGLRIINGLISIHPMFLLICKYYLYHEKTNLISIHPMFLLIQMRLVKSLDGNYFNTSHVSINRECKARRLYVSVISIHPMFLLISVNFSSISWILYFNTSHVSINPFSHKLRCCRGRISIHPMFLLIHLKRIAQEMEARFQYIPCFY